MAKQIVIKLNSFQIHVIVRRDYRQNYILMCYIDRDLCGGKCNADQRSSRSDVQEVTPSSSGGG